MPNSLHKIFIFGSKSDTICNFSEQDSWFFLHKEEYNVIIRSTSSQFTSIMSNLVNASGQDNGGSNGIIFLIHHTNSGFSL